MCELIITTIILEPLSIGIHRQKGLILNIASAVGTFPCPLYTIYSASKAYAEEENVRSIFSNVVKSKHFVKSPYVNESCLDVLLQIIHKYLSEEPILIGLTGLVLAVTNQQAFVYTFSKALQVEYKEKGIIIQVVTPYGVSTPMSMNPKPNLITKSAQDFARESLDYVRLSDETHGCLAHEILALFLHLVPLWVFHSDKVQETFLRMIAEYQKKTQKST